VATNFVYQKVIRRLGVGILLAISAACERAPGAGRDPSGLPSQRSSSRPAELPRWPADPNAGVTGSGELTAVPSCGSDLPLIAPGSVGPLRPGQSLEQVAATCPRALALWDWGHEPIPEPMLVVHLGGAIVELTFEDTLASSRVVNVRISHPRARTAEGVGAGSTLGDLVRAYGPARFEEGECVLYATFERAEGLSFQLRLPRPFECTDVTRLAQSQRGVPSEARVQTVVVHGGDRAT
jgi:hypothetical protein